MPGSWGLAGDVYAEAEANYYYDGEELERKLIDIRYKDYPIQQKIKHLELDHKYGKVSGYEKDLKLLEIEDNETPQNIAKVKFTHKKISEYEYDKIVAENDVYEDEIDKEIALLKVDHKHKKIKTKEFEKKLATFNNEPWIGILNDEYKAENGVSGFLVEMDWNDQFIEMLRVNGYTGISDEHIVEQWFVDVNNSVATDENIAVLPLRQRMRDNGII